MKTIEEKAKEYACIKKEVVIDEEERYYNGGINKYDAFLAGYKAAQEWISVDDELPKNNMYILVKDKDTISSIYFEIEEDECVLISGFTHWRPIEIN